MHPPLYGRVREADRMLETGQLFAERARFQEASNLINAIAEISGLVRDNILRQALPGGIVLLGDDADLLWTKPVHQVGDQVRSELT